ncbi:MAG: SDR family oxidoreductase [Pyrinomonadaceae bacterium]|nr:SDR family oxidoreductase [Pyrinomonadaceae bacterium]
MNKRSILLTGATGYVGGRLLKVLEAQGHTLNCIARTPAYLRSRVAPTTRVFSADVLDKESLRAGLAGMDTAYYLIHSLGESKGFEEQEKVGAQNFAVVAKESGVKRIIYLGGMGNEGEELSPHLRSRHEVGRILRDSGVPTLEFRASIVLGSGSLSFEMIRALTEHLPIMIMPRWVSVLAQPIGIQDLIGYLVQALDIAIEASEVVEIGGADQLSYRQLMKEYARLRNLKRVMIPVPVLTPRLSSLWLGLVTPLYARVGRKLIESIKHPTIVTSNRAHELFALRPCGAAEAMRAALENEDRKFAETRWSDSLSASGTPRSYGGYQFCNRMIDYREKHVEATPQLTFQVIESIGGNKGWFGYDFLWRWRGILDLLVGGVGMRRGRPTHRSLRPGDALDFWRVEEVERPHKLRLLAEMKLPGRAWLEFVVQPQTNGSVIQQTAIYDPIGLSGRIYWYCVYPLHALIFQDMIDSIASRVMRQPEARPTATEPGAVATRFKPGSIHGRN